jgi:hypothetical protein
MSKPQGILHNTHIVSPKTGIRYWIDGEGKATPVEEDAPFLMCECEIDWRCALHSDRMYTAIELSNDEWASRQADQDRFWQAV